VDETIHCHHLTQNAAETHLRALRREGFEAKVTRDGDRWLVTAHRDDGEDDGYTVSRLEAFRRD